MAERSLGYRIARYVWRRTGKRLVYAVRVIAPVIKNVIMRAFADSDYKRWSSSESLEMWWDERTRVIAGLVRPDSRVIEFGAGRRQLEKFLPASCRYTPSDLVDRGPGTIVCDLNRRPLPDLRHLCLNVAVFGGVLEYIADVPSLVLWIASIGIQTCIASFDAIPDGLSFIGKLKERIRRYQYGYQNNLTEEQFLRCFEAANMKCKEKRVWTTQKIYRFVRLAA